MSNSVIVPEWLMGKCHWFGQQVVEDYLAGRNPESRALAMNGVDKDVGMQTMGRVAECAVCLWAGLDPLQALNWSRHCDVGYDVMLKGYRFDIKASRNGAQYLIWPLTKNTLFDAKPFDALGFVRVDDNTCDLVGWIDKPIFRKHHQTADENHKLLCGTWFMPCSRLYPFKRDAWAMS